MHLVPAPGQTPEPKPWQGLAVELEKLRKITTTALDKTNHSDPEAVDSLTKLVGATAKLAKACLECERTVTQKEVNALIASMGAAVSAHVRDKAVLGAINREWMALVREATG